MEKKIGSHTVELTNQDKVLFPKDGFTKKDIVDYYGKIADSMIPYARDRPLTLIRYPNGIHKKEFFQQKASDYFPDWIERVEVPKREGGKIEHAVLEKKEDLVYLANLAVITFHIWLSSTNDLEHPDRMIFDFDPSNSDFSLVREGALIFRDVCEEIDLVPFPMVTGSRGIHVVIPIKREMDFDRVRDFAREVAGSAVKRHPKELTLEQSKDKRGERLLIDVIRNSFGQTHVAPFSIRAKDGAPVATPVSWKEVESKDLGPQKFNIRNVFERLDRKNPWGGFESSASSLVKAKEKFSH